MPKKLIYTTVALVSFCTLLFELLQVRIFSFIFWNHVVYLVLAMALLGFGISGSLVAIFGSSLLSDQARGKTLSWLLLAFAITSAFALAATTCHTFLGLHLSYLKLGLGYIIYLLPFIFAGATLSICLSATEYQIGKLYAIDLLSAGVACVVFSLLLPLLGPNRLVGLITFSMSLLSYLWARNSNRWQRTAIILTNVIGLLLLVLPTESILKIYPELEKYPFYYFLSQQGSSIEKTVWTPLSRVDVISCMDKYSNPPNSYSCKAILQDGTAFTIMQPTQTIMNWPNWIKSNPDTAFRIPLISSPDCAIIGVGGGRDVLFLLAYNAKTIYGAELNPATYGFLTRDYLSFTGHIYEDPRIHILNEEGRSMLRHLNRKFDVMVINGVDTGAASTNGAYVLSENYLYTVEAFQEYFSHLSNNGVLSVFRLHQIVPPKEMLRVVSLGCEAFRRNGCNSIKKQIFVFGGETNWILGSRKYIGVLFKTTPFTEHDLNILERQANYNHADILYYPKLFSKEKQLKLEHDYYKAVAPNAVISHNIFNRLIRAYSVGTQDKFFSQYPYSVTPTTDDQPFFFEYHSKEPVHFDWYRGNAVYMTIYIVLLESLIFTLCAIFCPLWKFKREGLFVPHATSFSIYFSALGMGFMLIEVVLIQKSVLFLGNPLYSLSTVLASLLISAGLGSGIAAKFNWSLRKVITIFGALFIVFIGCFAFMLNHLFYNLMYLSLPVRVLIAFLIIFPAGILMGTFFPAGLKVVQEKASDYVPWAWSINGCASVFGSFAAIALAINYGFSIALLAGVLIYLIGFYAALRFLSPPIKQT